MDEAQKFVEDELALFQGSIGYMARMGDSIVDLAVMVGRLAEVVAALEQRTRRDGG